MTCTHVMHTAKPTEAQAEAGNYRKAHISVQGLDIAIETPKGRRRRPEWPPMGAHYGYIKRTEGADGDAVDVFVGPHKDSPIVFVVDQCDASGNFDEHKALIGFYTEKQAVEAYKSSYTPSWKVGPVTAMTIAQFKAWLAKGSQEKPVEPQVSCYSNDAWDESKHPREKHGRFIPSISKTELDNLPATGWRQHLAEWALGNLRGKKYVNAATGWEIAVTRSGIEKTIAQPDVSAKAILKLPELLRAATDPETKSDRHNRDGVIAYIELMAPLTIEGQHYDVRVKLREIRGQGLQHYSLHALEINEKSLSPKEGLSDESPRADLRQTSSDQIIDPPDDEVKKYSLGAREMSLADEMTAHVLRYMAVQEAPRPTDTDPRAVLIADILMHVFGPRIEALLDAMEPTQYATDGEPLQYMKVYEWDEKLHPRDAKGRFAKASTTEQLEAAHTAVTKALRAPRTAESAKQLMEHLSQLSVAHLHEIKKRHNIGASGRNKAELIAKLAKRLDVGRREVEQKSNPPEKPDSSKPATQTDLLGDAVKEPKKPTPTPEPKAKEKQGKMFHGMDDQPGQESLWDDIDSVAKDDTPAGKAATAAENASEAGKDPRQVAQAAQKALDADYEFARASAVRNAGEDLKGSARHKINQWKGLAEAEENGTADKLITRDQLLANEPHNLMIHADRNPLTSLAMHYALRAFPAKPGTKTASNAKKDREQFLDAYKSVKDKAEELAKTHGDHQALEAVGKLQSHVADLIKKYRGQKTNDYIGAMAAPDRYNQTANDLVGLHKSLAQGRQANKTGVVGKLNEFAKAVQEKYGTPFKEVMSGHAKDAVLDMAADHAKDIMDGQSLNKTFGKEGKAQNRFNPADHYVKHATRKGGRDVSHVTADPNKATKHLIDRFGMRGVQWGNTVSDEERKHHAAKAVEALSDLADVTGLHPKDIALDGKLGLAIGARGKGNASAHYEPDSQVINLTRASGVGTLAHEWGHGFDHMLSDFQGFMSTDHVSTHEMYEKSGKSLRTWKSNEITKAPDGWEKRERPLYGVRKAYGEWWKASKPFRDRLDSHLQQLVKQGRMSEKKAKEYWNSKHEIFARTFEQHVAHKLKGDNRDNTYLSGLAGEGGGLWPTAEESKQMAGAFDKIFTEYRKHKHGTEEPIQFSAAEAIAVYLQYKANPGRWITIGSNPDAPAGKKGGAHVFIDSNGQIKRGPKALKGQSIDAITRDDNPNKPRWKRKHAKHIEPSNKLDKAVAEVVGTHPDDHADFKEIVKQAHALHVSEVLHHNDGYRTVMDAMTKRGKQGVFIGRMRQAMNKGKDEEAIRGFDEALDLARNHAPHLLSHPSESNEADALMRHMSAGPRKLLSQHDSEIIELAREMAGEAFFKHVEERDAMAEHGEPTQREPLDSGYDEWDVPAHDDPVPFAAYSFDESKHHRDQKGRFTKGLSIDTPAGKIEVSPVKTTKKPHPLEGFRDSPEFKDMAYYEHEVTLSLDGKHEQTIKTQSNEADPDPDFDADIRYEVKALKKRADKKGQVVESGGEGETAWRIEHDGRGSYKAIAGDWYRESGLTKKQAKRFIEKEIAAFRKENASQYAADLASQTWLNYQAAWFTREALAAQAAT